MASYFNWMWEVYRSPDTRPILMWTGILFALGAAQALYGLAVSSLGLVADAFHMTFHCFALLISLWGTTYTRKAPSPSFTYGYDRYEVLATFSNALFLIFVVMFVMAGALRQLLFGEEPALEAGSALLLEFALMSE